MRGIERRAVAATAEGDGMTFRGLASVYNSPTYIGPPGKGFYEQVAPGAFRRALKDGADVVALFNHDPNMVLGRTSSGTLRLSDGDAGLATEIDLPDTTAGRDVSTLVGRGDIRGMSFSFRVASGGETWKAMPGGHSQIRTLTDFDPVLDVSPVTYPAYQPTTAEVRSAFAGTEARDYSALATYASAADAAVDAAVSAVASGNAPQASALMAAAQLAACNAGYCLWDVDSDLLAAVGAPDIAALVEAAGAAIDAAAGNLAVIEAASQATDALLDALHINDPDRLASAAEGDTDNYGERSIAIARERGRLLLRRPF